MFHVFSHVRREMVLTGLVVDDDAAKGIRSMMGGRQVRWMDEEKMGREEDCGYDESLSRG